MIERQLAVHTVAAFAAILAALAAGCGPTYPKCDNDEDCHEGEYCVNGMCQMCRSDADCPAGQACSDGACEPIPGYCQSNGDCGPNQECRNGRCVSTAQSNTDMGSQTAPSCQLSPIYFGFDQDDLDNSARSTIQANVTCMRELGTSAVHVTGHADPRGTEEYNLALGDRRAQSVRSYMVSLGLDTSAVSASSMGEEMAQGTDDASWARDRRVEFAPR